MMVNESVHIEMMVTNQFLREMMVTSRDDDNESVHLEMMVTNQFI